MKVLVFAFAAVVALISQVSALPVIAGSSQIIAPSNSVAYNLADTLNLLTVSSLLSGALPYQGVAKIPINPAYAIGAPAYALGAPACALSAPVSTCGCAPVSTCGCGCGCGCGSNYGTYYY